MALKGKTKIFDIGGSKAITVPASVRLDSTFPFKDENKELMLEIKHNQLLIRESNNKD